MGLWAVEVSSFDRQVLRPAYRGIGGVSACPAFGRDRLPAGRQGAGRQEETQYKEKFPLLASCSPLRAREAPPYGWELPFPTTEIKAFER